MKTREGTSRLRSLREKAGLTLRELARQIDERPSNISYWERTGRLPRSDLLAPIAKALGVTVEEVLGIENGSKPKAARGRLQQAFEAASQLPRRQQEQITKVVNALVIQANSSD